jgi:hypothetical protein
MAASDKKQKEISRLFEKKDRKNYYRQSKYYDTDVARSYKVSPRPGFVLDVDKSTPPILFWRGEELSLEKLPTGSRVIYPPEALPAIKNPREAIAHALDNPIGDSKPLSELLFAGMKLTIAFDDISLPLPPMQSPDNRQLVIEEVLSRAAAAGVDDVVLIAALALHRRMTDAELRHALGDRVFDSFAPYGLLLQHDAEDPENIVKLGETDHGETVDMNKRAAESDLLVYVNINLVPMDGGHKSVATGLASYESIKFHHNVKTMRHSKSFMDMHNSELHTSNWRMGRFIRENGPKIFQIETTLNTNTFPSQFRFLERREWEWNLADRISYHTTALSMSKSTIDMKRNILHSIKSPHAMTSVQAGEVEAVHELTLKNVFKQQLVTVEGQTDIVTMGLPYIGPYNVNSIMNPILVACLSLGYFFNMYKNRPVVRKDGVAIIFHTTDWAFHPVHHPSYIDFFEQVLSETNNPLEIEKNYEESFARDPWYIHLYRTSHAYHGVHPFYMWYWASHAMEHLSQVIIVGGNPKAVHRLGFKSASTFNDAMEMAEDRVGRDPTITHLHMPPLLMAEVI